MYSFRIHTVLYLAILFSGGSIVNAQGIDDLDIRQRVGIAYRHKDVSLTGKYILFTGQGGFTFSRSMIGLEGTYKIAKFLKAGGEYRFSTSHQRDFHRFYLYGVLDKSIGRLQGSYRGMYQQEVTYFGAEAQQDYPVRRQMRHLFDLTWHYSNRIDFYTNAELYYQFNSGTVTARRQVYAVGAGYLFKRRNQFGAELALYHSPVSVSRTDVIRASLSYTYILGDKKGKKKKKKKHHDKQDQAPAENPVR